MLNRIVKKIAGDYNAKQLAKLTPLVEKINHYYESWHTLSDEQIKNKTSEFRERLSKGETLDDLLPEAFATVKQACKRIMGQSFEVKGVQETRNMIPYDVQLVGGIVLHQGKIAEMRTGEGKTLVATLPAYLNALEGKGVHIVTVNDYLASRDAEWMGYLYQRLGLSVGSVTKQTPLQSRRGEYEKDITYVENSELGFDYLRDNLAKSMQERKMLRRPLHYAIIDEVDSILIDEARTPMIISQPSEEATDKYRYYAQLVTLLTPSKHKKKVKKGFLQELLKKDEVEEEEDDGGDYYIDEKTKTVSLSSAGIAKLENLLKVDNLYKDLGYQEIHHIENALKAQACYVKDKDYLIRDGQIMIVDENTGRVMPGRRFSQGLHQALEAKEQVEVQRESKTLASITYQHFFKQYKKLAGMTGTALTEAEEFEKIYNLEVFEIPTNKPIIRVDKGDQVYFNQNAKWKAVVDYIQFYHKIGVPMLIGTSSIKTSELVSSMLDKMNLPHYVLNAKFHESEANIVKNAGKKGSVVVATNMAGRGTDIKLEAGLMEEIAKNYAKWLYTGDQIKKNEIRGKKMPEKIVGQAGIVYSEFEYTLTLQALKDLLKLDNEQIEKAKKGFIDFSDGKKFRIELNTRKKTKEDPYARFIIKSHDEKGMYDERDLHYGLFILGTEKHDSRRIDNQLRGRAGRQGDPGVSQFFVALDDEIMRKMGGDKIQAVARMMLSKEDLENMSFTQKQFTNSIIRAQKQMEGRHYGIRKHLFDYDSVINKQRERIYAKRDAILKKNKELGAKSEEGKGSAEQKNDAKIQKVQIHSDIGKNTKKSGTSEYSDLSDRSESSQLIELSVKDEIRYFIDEIVENLVKTYTAFKPWNLTELLEELEQITTASFLESEYSMIKNAKDLEEKLKKDLHNLFDAKFEGIEDEEKVLERLRRIYLYVLDQHRQEHIDDMTYLREKVGLYGYAQLDPLVIYKKEAYEKFQRLLSTIRRETLAQVFRTDFHNLASFQQTPQAPQKVDMKDILQAITVGLKTSKKSQVSDSKESTKEAKKVVKLDNGKKAEVLESDDDFEVLEITEDSENNKTEVDIRMKKRKIRPNDRISIRYKDGRVEHNVKYKKVRNVVEKGEAEII